MSVYVTEDREAALAFAKAADAERAARADQEARRVLTPEEIAERDAAAAAHEERERVRAEADATVVELDQLAQACHAEARDHREVARSRWHRLALLECSEADVAAWAEAARAAVDAEEQEALARRQFRLASEKLATLRT